MTNLSLVKVKVQQSLYRPGQALRVPRLLGSQISWHSAYESGKVVSPTYRLPWDNPRAIVRPEGLWKWKIAMKKQCIRRKHFSTKFRWVHVTYCNLLWLTVTYCELLWLTVTYCELLWLTVTYCELLWNTVTYCDLLWPTVTYCDLLWPTVSYCDLLWPTVSYCDIL